MRMEFVQDFHRKYGFETLDRPGFLDTERMASRMNFLLEELQETAHASGLRFDGEKFVPMNMLDELENRDLEEVLDGLIDLVYVAFGTADLMGFNRQCPLVPVDNGEWSVWQEASMRVQQANMKKVRVEKASESKRGTIFDVKKPEDWVPPSYGDILQED